MSLPRLVFPIIGLDDRVVGREDWEMYWTLDSFVTAFDFEMPNRPGMLVIDSDCECWRVSNVRILGRVGGFWRRLYLSSIGMKHYRLDQDLIPVINMSFADVQASLRAAIQNNWDMWRDDEAIAGEDGPPRDEQELRNELKEKVLRANDVVELMSNLWGEDLDRVAAFADASRALVSNPSEPS